MNTEQINALFANLERLLGQLHVPAEQLVTLFTQRSIVLGWVNLAYALVILVTTGSIIIYAIRRCRSADCSDDVVGWIALIIVMAIVLLVGTGGLLDTALVRLLTPEACAFRDILEALRGQ